MISSSKTQPLLPVLWFLAALLSPVLSSDHEGFRSILETSMEASEVATAKSISTLSGPNCKEWNADNRLECWLWQLQVEIPNESFSADWITVSIRDMVCTKFAVRKLQSDYVAPHSLELAVDSIQASCHGKYHASGGISGHVRAGVAAAASHLGALEVSFRILPSTAYPLPRPYTFRTTQCQTNLKAKGIHFSGSMSARLIQAFSKMIGHHITDALKGQLCPLLPKQLDPLLTDYLHQLDDWMQPYLPEKGTVEGVQNITGLQSSIPETMIVGGSTKTKRRRLGSKQSGRNELQQEAFSLLSSGNTTLVNPLDWKAIHWSLETFNSQLEKHLQNGWFLNANNTRNYCSQQCQDLFRGLSGWFRSIVGPQLTIPLPKLLHNISLPSLPLHTDASIGFEHVSIQGLDQLDTLQLLRPVASHSGNNSGNVLTSHISSPKPGLYIETPMLLNINMADSEHSLLEPFTVKVNVSHLETHLATTLRVMDWDKTTLLQVVNAVQRFVERPTPANIRSTLGCLIRTFRNVENLDWVATVVLESISITRSTARLQNQSDQLEDALDHVINSLLQLLLGEYSGLWTDLMHGLVRDPARHTFNSYLKDWINRSSSIHTCPAVPVSKEPKWLNFSKFLVLDHFNDFLNHQSTIHTVNRFLGCFGEVLEGFVAAQATEKHLNSLQGLVEVVRAKAKYWDALQNVQLLQPTGDNTLRSSINWGSNTTVPQLELTLQVATAKLSGTINVTVFTGLHAQLGTQLDYNLDRLENLTVAHLVQQVECAMVPMALFQMRPDVTAADLGPWVGLNLSALLNNQSVVFSTDEKDTYHVARIAASAMDYSVELLRSLANKALEDWVLRSSGVCPGIVPDDPVPDNPNDRGGSDWYDFPMIWIVIVLLVFGQGAIVGMVEPARSNGDDNENDNEDALTDSLLSRPSEDEILDPSPLEDDVNDLARDIGDMDRSLLNDIRQDNIDGSQAPEFQSASFLDEAVAESEQNYLKPLLIAEAVPETVRFAIPVLIVGTIILLFTSNVSVGASVDMSIRLGATPIHVPGLFEFSLGNTVAELYGAGIYPLLFLVVVFSGVWPYAKLVWMFYIWNAPYPEATRREQRLQTLDALSKFSLVDTYVLVVMLVAFRFHLELSEELGLDVYVIPEYGFYAFLLATCLSLVIGHAMLYFDRRSQQSEQAHEVMDLIEVRSIFDHAFDVEDNGPRRRLSRFFQVFLFISCLSATIFLIMGFGQECFTFEFGGLAGMALGDNSKTTYSLVSLGFAIPGSVEDSNSVSVLFLQIAYFFYAVLMPVACLIILLFLLMYPATLQVQRRLLVAAEIANAWSAVEVFVLSIVAALFQISAFASFIIGDKCDLVNKVAGSLIGDNLIPEDDAVCFSVVASVESNCYYLVVGALLNSFAVSLALRVAHPAVHERAGHICVDSVARQMYNLPIQALCFGPEVPFEEGQAQLDGDENANEVGDENANEEDDVPAWRSWF